MSLNVIGVIAKVYQKYIVKPGRTFLIYSAHVITEFFKLFQKLNSNSFEFKVIKTFLQNAFISRYFMLRVRIRRHRFLFRNFFFFQIFFWFQVKYPNENYLNYQSLIKNKHFCELSQPNILFQQELSLEKLSFSCLEPCSKFIM